MDADFSVRNEVDSICPPYGETFSYDHQPSPYYDIISGINKAPPFPSAPIPQNQNQQLSPYFSLMHQQLMTQQEINNKLIERLTREETIPWKYISLTLCAALVFLFLQNGPLSRKNPRIVYLSE